MKAKKSIFPLLIAEVANCHGGDEKYLNALVKRLCETSVEAIKFQLIIADELLTPRHSQYALFSSLEFDYLFWREIAARVKKVKKKLIFDLFGKESLSLASRLDADMFKIYASDIDDLVFIKEVLAHKKPVFISTGGAALSEIDAIMKIGKGRKICLLVGFQSYPTPINESHLNRIGFLRSRYGCEVGFMDHSGSQDKFNTVLPCLAIANGATTIEKHVFLSSRKTSYDWQSAIDPEQIDELHCLLVKTMQACKDVSLGLTDLEKKYFRQKRKVAVAACDIQPDNRLDKSKVIFRLADQKKGEDYIYRREINSFLGKTINRCVERYEALAKGMFK